jgi:hypothetical protein
MTKTSIKTKFGTARIEKKGYYYISSRKEGNNGKFLHRLIFEDFYKIQLPKNIHIHHEDGNKLNNEIWNLIPMTLSEHSSLHCKGWKHTEEEKKKKSELMSNKMSTTGLYRVSKTKCSRCKQGFTWMYRYYDKTGKRHNISSTNLHSLKEKVLSEGLEWKELATA